MAKNGSKSILKNIVAILTMNHTADRIKNITTRICDLIFLLNELEKKNPRNISKDGIEVYFHYQLSQHQRRKKVEN